MQALTNTHMVRGSWCHSSAQPQGNCCGESMSPAPCSWEKPPGASKCNTHFSSQGKAAEKHQTKDDHTMSERSDPASRCGSHCDLGEHTIPRSTPRTLCQPSLQTSINLGALNSRGPTGPLQTPALPCRPPSTPHSIHPSHSPGSVYSPRGRPPQPS